MIQLSVSVIQALSWIAYRDFDKLEKELSSPVADEVTGSDKKKLTSPVTDKNKESKENIFLNKCHDLWTDLLAKSFDKNDGFPIWGIDSKGEDALARVPQVTLKERDHDIFLLIGESRLTNNEEKQFYSRYDWKDIEIYKEDLHKVWPIQEDILITSKETLSPQKMKTGRPSEKSKIYEALSQIPINNEIWKKPHIEIAKHVATSCGNALGSKGWQDRTVCRHIGSWMQENQLK